MEIEKIRIVDTHTGGEPTRVVLDSPIQFRTASMRERRDEFRSRFDDYRKAIVCEPRGSDVLVGALLTPPERQGSVAGVIFFNNVGYLGMCGHGTMGVAVTLLHLGLVQPGRHQLDTPVGTVAFELAAEGRVSLQNVPSFRHRSQVPVPLDDARIIHGDIAWGGNWLFICEDHGLAVCPTQIEALNSLAKQIRRQLQAKAITGPNGEEIDHIDLIGVPSSPSVAESRNFVLCPGGAYDRSPCGTGTSAKLACLAASGKLQAGEIYRQESIVGSVFECSFEFCDDARQIVPTIAGSAYVNAQAEFILNPQDPFCMGIA